MDTHVATQVPGLRKPDTAALTLVRLLAGVNTQMFGQRRTVGKSAGTDATPVGTLTAVSAHVRGNR